MNTLTDLTISEALVKLKRREISPVELTQAYIESMESNKKYNAYITTAGEQALEKAKAAEAKYADGSNRKLEGIPLGIKDLFCTKDLIAVIRLTTITQLILFNQIRKLIKQNWSHMMDHQ